MNAAFEALVVPFAVFPLLLLLVPPAEGVDVVWPCAAASKLGRKAAESSNEATTNNVNTDNRFTFPPIDMPTGMKNRKDQGNVQGP